MRFERTQALDLVRHIMTHRGLYRFIGDDFAPVREDFQPVDDPRIWYVLAHDDEDQPLGLFIALAQSAVCWEIHCCLLPIAWGRSAEASAGVFAWLFANTTAQRIVGSIPRFNRLCIALARRSGMVEYGVNPASFLKHGKLHDQILFGISKG